MAKMEQQSDYGASFLTGGLIAVGLLVSTVVGTSIISMEWAPAPRFETQYIDTSKNQDGTVIMSASDYLDLAQKLNSCQDQLAKETKTK
jgi:hypothetical protein